MRISHNVAKSGEEWFEAFRTHASGTYANQYMVVDFSRFTPGQPLRDGTLWVVEEMPGLVVGADQTDALARGYWPSYNVPFYKEVYARSGYAGADLGTDGSYELARRAQIFRRDHNTVTDIPSFKRILRYANYSDPVALRNGSVDYSAAICMRGDLAKSGTGKPDGCYDTKVTSARTGFATLAAEVVNGPSSSASSMLGNGEGYAPFRWRPADNHTHDGLPAVYNFGFVSVRPKELQPSTIVV